jgi:hypothetical protein
MDESLEMISGSDPVIFTHVVLVLHEPAQVIRFMTLCFGSDSAGKDQSSSSKPTQSQTTLIVITDLTMRRDLMQHAPGFDYEGLQRDRRLRFVFKPLKPSKFAKVFDPQKEREMSTDKALEGAQAVAVSQKQVFDEMKRRLGGKNFKVLLVEDNKTNQMVSAS